MPPSCESVFAAGDEHRVQTVFREVRWRSTREIAAGCSIAFDIANGCSETSCMARGAAGLALSNMVPYHYSFEAGRQALIARCASDHAFDALLPGRWRAMSFSHWTPVAVARKAAIALEAYGARRVLDIGSGAGKLCLVAAATCPKVEFLGIERSVALIKTSRALARALCLPNARFVLGDVLRTDWSRFDGLYSFNPFIDEWTEVSPVALQLTGRLTQARPGSVLATYFCCGAPIPASFELAADQMVEGARLRIWVKSNAREVERFHIESADDLETLTRDEVIAALRRDLRRFV